MKKSAPKAQSRRHPLNLQPAVLFGKPFGNGIEVPDLSDAEMREWQYQNGEMFLARLPLWKRMAPRRAAAVRDCKEGRRMTARPQHASPAPPERVRVLRWALARDERERRPAPKLDTFPAKVAKPKPLKRKRKH